MDLCNDVGILSVIATANPIVQRIACHGATFHADVEAQL